MGIGALCILTGQQFDSSGSKQQAASKTNQFFSTLKFHHNHILLSKNYKYTVSGRLLVAIARPNRHRCTEQHGPIPRIYVVSICFPPFLCAQEGRCKYNAPLPVVLLFWMAILGVRTAATITAAAAGMVFFLINSIGHDRNQNCQNDYSNNHSCSVHKVPPKLNAHLPIQTAEAVARLS